MAALTGAGCDGVGEAADDQDEARKDTEEDEVRRKNQKSRSEAMRRLVKKMEGLAPKGVACVLISVAMDSGVVKIRGCVAGPAPEPLPPLTHACAGMVRSPQPLKTGTHPGPCRFTLQKHAW